MEVQSHHQSGTMPTEFPHGKFQSKRHQTQDRTSQPHRRTWHISKAYKIMGFSRDTFYRHQTARDVGSVEALFEISRKKPNLKNRVKEATEQAAGGLGTCPCVHSLCTVLRG
jgi:hypothetical protein